MICDFFNGQILKCIVSNDDVSKDCLYEVVVDIQDYKRHYNRRDDAPLIYVRPVNGGRVSIVFCWRFEANSVDVGDLEDDL